MAETRVGMAKGSVAVTQTSTEVNALALGSRRERRKRGLQENKDESSTFETIVDTLYEAREVESQKQIYNTATEAKRLRKEENENVAPNFTFQDMKKRLTYGEVTYRSVLRDIFPRLELTAKDVFYDVGCGTGKIVIQAALHTLCKAKGIELAEQRVGIALEALNRLRLLEGKLSIPRKITSNIVIVQGDACSPPSTADLSDATVVFINNVCFDADLMSAILEKLSESPNLRRLVTLRKICERHRNSICQRNGSKCLLFSDPPQVTNVEVTWTTDTTAYFYDRI